MACRSGGDMAYSLREDGREPSVLWTVVFPQLWEKKKSFSTRYLSVYLAPE